MEFNGRPSSIESAVHFMMPAFAGRRNRCRVSSRRWVLIPPASNLSASFVLHKKIMICKIPCGCKVMVHRPRYCLLVTATSKNHGLTQKDLDGQTVAILGLGASGKAAAELALARGASVLAIDRNENLLPLEVDPLFQKYTRLRTVLAPSGADFLKDADRVVVSPGVPLETYGLAGLLESGKEVMSELDFAAEVLHKETAVLAISGTNGKSTVTSYASQLLQHSGIKAFVGGNFGNPLSKAALQCMGSGESQFQVAVVEVSSYQLEIPNKYLHPSVAVILNLTPDHLERHKTMWNYAYTKCRLFCHMTDCDLAVLPADNQLLVEAFRHGLNHCTLTWIGDLPGLKMVMDKKVAYIELPTTGLSAELKLDSLNTVGNHNFQNAAVATFCVLGLNMGIEVNSINEAIGKLSPLPHRMQIVHIDNEGKIWVNDSKATNVEATYAGLVGMKEFKSVVLLGGIAKQNAENNGSSGFEKLAEPLKCHKAVITFGASGEMIWKALLSAGLSIPCTTVKCLVDAVSLARDIAKSGVDADMVAAPSCKLMQSARLWCR
ncbi:uncharacterized protein LOC116255802 isoform X2 [Nymphaea colorata]|uniref:uncharacterized protein LOC116255802 isoform X2 n=1 Tax=Nymphaea colorata TaxID=210225 RepID=UPI00214EF976|nr:uncharacterized protein LOC116255802 isoform X2 [Nymphaea colorata]